MSWSPGSKSASTSASCSELEGLAPRAKNAPSHRQILGRMVHQDSCGCWECSNGNLLGVEPRKRARCASRVLLEELGDMRKGLPLLMDRAYEGDETRQLVLDLDVIPVVLPKSNRTTSWQFDREICKKRNEIEKLFRRLKGFRRTYSRLENWTPASVPS